MKKNLNDTYSDANFYERIMEARYTGNRPAMAQIFSDYPSQRQSAPDLRSIFFRLTKWLAEDKKHLPEALSFLADRILMNDLRDQMEAIHFGLSKAQDIQEPDKRWLVLRKLAICSNNPKLKARSFAKIIKCADEMETLIGREDALGFVLSQFENIDKETFNKDLLLPMNKPSRPMLQRISELLPELKKLQIQASFEGSGKALTKTTQDEERGKLLQTILFVKNNMKAPVKSHALN